MAKQSRMKQFALKSFLVAGLWLATPASQAFWLPSDGFITAYSWGEANFVVATENSIQVYESRTLKQLGSASNLGGNVTACTSDGKALAWIFLDANGSKTIKFKREFGDSEPLQVTLDPSQANRTPLILGGKIFLVGKDWKMYSDLTQNFEPIIPKDSSGKNIAGQPVRLSQDLVATIKPYKYRNSTGKKELLSEISTYLAKPNGLKFLAKYISDAPVYRSILVKKQDKKAIILDSSFEISQSNLTLRADGLTVWEKLERVDLPVRSLHWSPKRILRTLSDQESPLWQNQKGIIKIKTGEKSQAFLPWNGASDAILGIIPRQDFAWVFSKKGVSMISSHNVSADFGFGGYVAQTSGDDNQESWSQAQKTLVNELTTWFGTKYRLGGNDRTGIDCSGLVQQTFKTIGINLPRTSATLRTTKLGKIVRDNLIVGDVLTYPGHVAVYVGDGKTIETVKGGVSYGSIWSRRDVVVRRFIGL